MTFVFSLTLGTLFVWSCMMFWSPWEPPQASRPLIVLGLAWALSTAPLRPLEIVAAAGAVGIAYYFVEH